MKGVADCLATRDVVIVLQDVVQYTQKNLDALTHDELEHYVKKRLLKRRKYVATLPFYDVLDFPRGLHVGPGTTHLFNDLPKEARGILESNWDYEFERVPGIYVGKRDEFLQRKKDATFLRIEVEACGFEKASEKATLLAEDSLATFRSAFDEAFPIRAFLLLAEDGSILESSRNGGVLVVIFGRNG